ncbi:MAG: lipopolysaccharide biosynthesis protein [Cellulomonadaceae bacterium]
MTHSTTGVGALVPERGLGGTAAHGALLTMGSQIGRIALQMASVVVLARILVPEDYGLVAMAMAVVGVGELFRDFGLSSAAIQAPTLSRSQRDNLFWINSAIGAVLMVAAFGASGLIAALFGEPRLVLIVQALSVTFLLNGAATQHRASLTRTMAFGRLAVADVTAPLAAFLASLMVALLGGGYWAIVTQMIVTAVVTLALSVTLGGWLPRWWHRGSSVRPLLTYGGNLLGSQLLGYLANNIDTLVIGLRFGAAPLGFYNRSYQLLMRPLSQVRAPATTVALPVLSRVSGTQERFDRFVRTGQLALCLPLMLVLAVVVGATGPVVEVFLGTAWSPSAPILRFLAIAALFDTLAFVGYWIYLSRGLTHELLKFSAVSASIRIITILVGSTWGPVGVAAGYALEPLLTWPLSLWWLSRVTVIPRRQLYAGAGRIIAQGVTVALAAHGGTWMVAGSPAWVQLATAAAAGTMAYALLTVLTPPLRRDLREVVAIGRLALKRRVP